MFAHTHHSLSCCNLPLTRCSCSAPHPSCYGSRPSLTGAPRPVCVCNHGRWLDYDSVCCLFILLCDGCCILAACTSLDGVPNCAPPCNKHAWFVASLPSCTCSVLRQQRYCVFICLPFAWCRCLVMAALLHHPSSYCIPCSYAWVFLCALLPILQFAAVAACVTH